MWGWEEEEGGGGGVKKKYIINIVPATRWCTNSPNDTNSQNESSIGVEIDQYAETGR